MEKYMMKVQGCCCCATLRTGTLILLWSVLIYSTWILVTNASTMWDLTNSRQADNVIKFLFTVFYVYDNVNLIFLKIIPCAYGLYGINENKPSYLKPYIFVSILGIVIVLITCVFVLLLAIFSSNLLKSLLQEIFMIKMGLDLKILGMTIGMTAFITILTLISYSLLGWYFLSVVYHYYQEMKGEQPTSYPMSDYNAPPTQEDPLEIE